MGEKKSDAAQFLKNDAARSFAEPSRTVTQLMLFPLSKMGPWNRDRFLTTGK